MKGKVGEALAAGLPVVGTEIAFEGMDLEHGHHVLQANDPRGFADAVIRLHREEALWSALARAGRAQVEARLGPAAARDGLRALLSRLAGDLWIGEEAALDGFLQSYEAGDNVVLMVPVPVDADAQAAAVDRITARIGELGHDVEDIPDVTLVPADTLIAAPSRARLAPTAATGRHPWVQAPRYAEAITR